MSLSRPDCFVSRWHDRKLAIKVGDFCKKYHSENYFSRMKLVSLLFLIAFVAIGHSFPTNVSSVDIEDGEKYWIMDVSIKSSETQVYKTIVSKRH